MKKTFYLGLSLIALLCVLGWTGYGQKQSAGKGSWEYLAVSTGEAKYREAAGLNGLGALGWELVSVGTTDSSGNVVLYFKRSR